jgi:hypothetical protein
MASEAVEKLINEILEGRLSYYQATGSIAYVAQYQDGEHAIVYNSHSAKHARPGVNFEIVASARWEDCLGNPRWTVYDYGDGDGEAVAVAATATESDGTITDTDVYYYPI